MCEDRSARLAERSACLLRARCARSSGPASSPRGQPPPLRLPSSATSSSPSCSTERFVATLRRLQRVVHAVLTCRKTDGTLGEARTALERLVLQQDVRRRGVSRLGDPRPVITAASGTSPATRSRIRLRRQKQIQPPALPAFSSSADAAVGIPPNSRSTGCRLARTRPRTKGSELDPRPASQR
ncbi:hypothetical protein AAT19DRAFT_10652 [Rhodotorula toruloides]|uniref:Uncharacterized protein n=1 Tax=Rhodotorula toruloides TaxID=5286 RepID=A0A2S9ZZD1_RHOTO|nr:hypothetical protein AAT19DRAFT_10652 [Rhodotorula toruloides]